MYFLIYVSFFVRRWYQQEVTVIENQVLCRGILDHLSEDFLGGCPVAV